MIRGPGRGVGTSVPESADTDPQESPISALLSSFNSWMVINLID